MITICLVVIGTCLIALAILVKKVMDDADDMDHRSE
jgi:hypothetical protein